MAKPENVNPKEARALGPIVAILAMCTATSQLGTSAVNAALPEMSSWAGNATQAQWSVVAYLLALTSASLVVGYLGDLMGRIRVLKGGLLLFVVASVMCALAPGMAVLILGRVVQGVGAAAMTVLPLALVRDSVPPGRSGTAMGTLGTAAAVGTASGPALGGLLMGMWGWPAIFWAMLPLPMLVLAALPAATHIAPSGIGAHRGTTRDTGIDPAQRPGAVFDLLGTTVLVATIAILSFVFTGGSSARAVTLILSGGAVLLLVLLIPIERRASHPILPAVLLRRPAVAGGAILNVTVAAIMMSTLVLGPFYLTGALGLGSAAMGVVMAAGPLTSVCVGVLAGRLVDRGDSARLVAFGLLLMAIAATALAFLPPIIGLPGYLTGTVLLAPGYQLFMAANNTQVMQYVSGSRRGTAAGILSLSRSIGQVTGASLVATFFATVIGDPSTASRTDFDTGLRIVFSLLALILLVAALLSTRMRATAVR